MALHDEILREILAGRVPWRFRTSDLKTTLEPISGRYRVGNREYKANTINTVPRNHSVRPDGTDPGDYVLRKGREPAFYWHGQGEFELILHRQHVIEDASPEDEDPDATEGDAEALVLGKSGESGRCPLVIKVDEDRVLRIAKSEGPDPAAIIVRYIAETPFQAYYRRKPFGRVKGGWGERLAAYFWPAPAQDWKATRPIVMCLSSRIQGAISRLNSPADDRSAAEELLTAFKQTCLWARLRLPESDSFVLAPEVLCVWTALSHREVPPSGCHLNSAWTKLYAFALPDDCVIYDSRVATAVTSILDPIMDRLCRCPEWQPYGKLGTIPGRGGSRPRDMRWAWKDGYKAWSSQTAANLLCRKVLTDVNQQAMTRPDCRKLDHRPWTLRDVEAVLFMEGY
jgi:hypothetical protein